MDAVRFVALTGPPSCGKSVALRALAHNRDVHRVYRDAVVLIQIAPRLELALFKEIASIVGVVCGLGVETKLLEKLQKSGLGQGAWDMLATSLLGRKVLFIFDGVGRHNRGMDAVLALKRAVQRHTGGVAVVSSCRSREVAQCVSERNTVVLVPALPERKAKIMLGFKEDEQVSDDVNKVLQKCSGIPLALTVAAGATKRMGGGPSTWKEYAAYLDDKFDQFGCVSGIFSAWKGVITEMGEEEVWGGGLTAMQALTAIVADGEQKAFRINELMYRWGVEEANVKKIVDVMETFWLVKRENIVGHPDVIHVAGLVADYVSYVKSMADTGARDMHGGDSRKAIGVRKTIVK